MGLPLLFQLIFSLCLSAAVALAASLSKPDCQATCGDVTIPLPFGIGPDCYLNSSYAITCNVSTAPPKPFLITTNLEVVAISIDSSTVEVVQPVSPLNCSGDLTRYSLGRALIGSPFTISAVHNSLTVLGCRNSVWLRANETTTISGCRAICDETSRETGCNGVNCCKTSIPAGLQELIFTYQSLGFGNTTRFCGYTFLAQQTWFQEDYSRYNGLHSDLLDPFDQDFQNVSIVLEFDLGNLEISEFTSCEYRGKTDTASLSNPESLTRLCYCGYGFQGNPYLPQGCQDIDECNSAGNNPCPDRVTCVNQLGSYVCRDNKFPVRTVFIILGSGFGALLLLFGSWQGSKAIRKKISANRRQKFFKQNGGLLLQQHLSSGDHGVDKTMLFTSKELAHATDHYNENRVLGRGGQGTVYKGMLSDGRIVAVKKSKRVDEGDLDVFINEVVILSQINHRNVVKLLGCCLEAEVPLLVYEFIPNGTLYWHIHEPNEEYMLNWEKRIQIAREVAGALAYLHSAASMPVYHRDIKSTNILLDEKYRAKVSDFGTSRTVAIDQTHLTTRVLGTFGYLDPEYFQSSQFTEKSDVYSFGVVMVELLTGEKAVTSVRTEEGRSLATHFLHSMEKNLLFNILDRRVVDEGKRDKIVAVAELARRCLHLNGKRRPTMREIVVELEGIQMQKEGVVHQQNHIDGSDHHAIEVDEPYQDSITWTHSSSIA